MVLSEGTTGKKKSPLTPPGIDPGTVRLVAQRVAIIYICKRLLYNIFIAKIGVLESKLYSVEIPSTLGSARVRINVVD
jgi:hypothetical protein